MEYNKSIVEEIRRIESEGKDGVLVLNDDQKNLSVGFQDGRINWISSTMDKYRIGQFLLKQGVVDSLGLRKLLSRSERAGEPLGQTAIDQRILSESELRNLLKQQACYLLQRFIKNGCRIETFKDRPASFSYPGRMSIDGLLLELARGDSSYNGMPGQEPYRLRAGAQAARFPWKPDEIAVLARLGRALTAAQLVDKTGLEEGRVASILSSLQRLQLVEMVEGPGRPANGVDQEVLPLESIVPQERAYRFSDRLAIVKEEFSFVSEQFRSLKVFLHELAAKGDLKVICVSSAEPQDGKSLVSTNLALCYSRDSHRKVALVDCDMRKPNLHNYFGIKADPGLEEYLSDGKLPPYSYLRRIKNLYVMTAGKPNRNPVEMLSHFRLQELVRYLREEFDTVILDCPPFHPIPDTRLILRAGDGLLTVIRRGKTSYRNVLSMFNSIDQAKLLGVVFNDVKPMAFNTNYDYRYYAYGHNYYGSEE
jgi:capsular exopolysaccharide synthesis family protein